MGGWPAEPPRQPSTGAEDLVVAGMGRRVGAWILDGFLSGFLVIVPVIIVLATHGIAFNQTALDQLADYPDQTATMPLLVINQTTLIIAAATYVMLLAAYYAGCWAVFRGTPCQRLLGLQVVDVRTSGNLSFTQSIVRWLAVAGLGEILSAALLLVFLNLFATVPFGFERIGNTYSTGAWSLNPQVTSANTLSSVVSGISTLWSIALLVSAGAHGLKRGLHDRASGSIVLGRAPAAVATPGWGYPPAGTPGWGYPPAQGGWSQTPPAQPDAGADPGRPMPPRDGSST